MNALNIALQQNQSQEIELSLPHDLKRKYSLNHTLAIQIAEQRQTIQNILNGHDHRLLVIAGPCSIHDEKSALEYAEKLKKIHGITPQKLSDESKKPISYCEKCRCEITLGAKICV